MLWVYAGLDLVDCDTQARVSLPEGYIDVSKTRGSEITETMATIYSHHPGSAIYLGFVDPLFMLTPPHEASCRRVFRGCTVALVCSNPLLLPYSWKNGTSKLVVVGSKTKTDSSNSPPLHHGGSPLLQHEAGHGRDAPRDAAGGWDHKD
jgi:hypothetical protein